MTFNVYYTERTQLDSSFLNRAWYDKPYQNLTLELHGVVYRYDLVPSGVFGGLVFSDSPGTYYRNNIQGVYHGRRLGPVADLREVLADDFNAVKVQEKTEPVRVQLHDVQAVEPTHVAVVTDPKTLTKLPLNKDVVFVSGVSDYTVHFTVEDTFGTSSDLRTHTLKADSVDNAVDKMFELADLLDQDIEVKGVYVSFE